MREGWEQTSKADKRLQDKRMVQMLQKLIKDEGNS